MGQTGKCRCGAISYEVTGDPAHTVLCWCNECRVSAGATPVQWALFPNAAVTINGTPVVHTSSPDNHREFCGTCGTSLFFRNQTIFPDQIDIQAGTFDDPEAFPPQAHIQVADAPAWFGTQGDLPKFDRYPPMPA